jgi:hypothetical protein
LYQAFNAHAYGLSIYFDFKIYLQTYEWERYFRKLGLLGMVWGELGKGSFGVEKSGHKTEILKNDYFTSE